MAEENKAEHKTSATADAQDKLQSSKNMRAERRKI